MILEKLATELKENKISLADAIVKALPNLKENQPDSTISWLASELQGYSNPLDFYYQKNHNFPSYRVVEGSLKLMNSDGSLVKLEHSLANRSKFFLSAPIAWLEESATLPGHVSITEMPELSHDIGAGKGVVIEYSGRQLKSILEEVKKQLLSLLASNS